MSHHLPIDDFRARRAVLDPDDFALSDGQPDPPSSDLVTEPVWLSVVALPDDVSIRTSDRHGSVLRRQLGLWTSWIEAADIQPAEACPSGVVRAILDVGDEFNAATYEILTGYYRQAASSLRTAVEVLLKIGSETLSGTSAAEFSYRNFSRTIGASDAAVALDHKLRARCNTCIFASARFGPWLGDLYGRLTNYAHAHSGFSLGDIRRSNGPVYVPSAVIATHSLFVETFMLVCVLARLARPEFKLSAALWDDLRGSVPLPRVGVYAFAELFPELRIDPASLVGQECPDLPTDQS